jgi:hypothetical protein
VAVTVEATADGATAAQLPELQLPSIPGAQVFADPPQSDETFVDGRPQVKLVRRFSIVPAQAGALRIAGPKLPWWDVRAGSARTASLPDIEIHVAPGANGPGAAPAAPTAATDAGDGRGWMRVPGVQGEVRPWAFAAVVFALLWLITFMWGLHRHPPPVPAATDAGPSGKAPPAASPMLLKRALDSGDLGDVADALRAMAVPPVRDLDALKLRLADARQRDAVDALQRARWGDGDGTIARALLRAAFERGPQWREPVARQASPLPPLYPER